MCLYFSVLYCNNSCKTKTAFETAFKVRTAATCLLHFILSKKFLKTYCLYVGSKKLKSSFLKRNFAGYNLKNESKENEQNLYENVPMFKWKSSPQRAGCFNNIASFTRFNNNAVNLIQSPVNLTNHVYQQGLHVSEENVCVSYDHLEQSWGVGNHSGYSYNYNTQASSLHPPSALSSGYSSVNQSCASSASTGSQRSRSPTPDHFEVLREESPLREAGRFGYQLRKSSTTNFCGVERSEELVVCGGGGDRHPCNSPVRGKLDHRTE